MTVKSKLTKEDGRVLNTKLCESNSSAEYRT